MKKDLEKLFEFTEICERLIQAKRFKDTPAMENKESVADHSWKLAVLAVVVAETLNLNIDKLKATKIALTHDLVEAITGDVDYFLVFTGVVTAEEKEIEEKKAIKEIENSLPGKIGKQIKTLWEEYQFGLSVEGRYIKALDKIEGIDHMIYRKVIDHPEKIALYADRAVLNFPELKPVLKAVKVKLQALYIESGINWKDEYDRV